MSDPALDGAVRELREAVRKAIAENGAPDFGMTIQLVAATEGVPQDDLSQWFSGFVSCLDYVRADPELMAGIARWWREQLTSVGADILEGSDTETAGGMVIMSAALLGRPGALR